MKLPKLFKPKQKEVAQPENECQSTFPKAIPDERHEGWCNFMTQEQMEEYYKIENFKNEIKEKIESVYPEINDLKITSSVYKGFYLYEKGKCNLDTDDSMKIYLDIKWIDGVAPCNISKLIEEVRILHFEEIPIYRNEHFPGGSTVYVQPYVFRKYSEQVILQACRKYADCISKDLPLNMHNIHCFKVGNVSLYDLAIGELDLKDVI